MTAEVLIVDDNADIRNILNDLIIEAGYTTRVAANYSQALKEIDKKPTIIKKPLQSGFSTNIHSSIKKALAHPSVASIIVGSINKAHLRDNIKYATSL